MLNLPAQVPAYIARLDASAPRAGSLTHCALTCALRGDMAQKEKLLPPALENARGELGALKAIIVLESVRRVIMERTKVQLCLYVPVPVRLVHLARKVQSIALRVLLGDPPLPLQAVDATRVRVVGSQSSLMAGRSPAITLPLHQRS